MFTATYHGSRGRADIVGPLRANQPSFDSYVQQWFIYATLPSYAY